jgi:hypothetical protein
MCALDRRSKREYGGWLVSSQEAGWAARCCGCIEDTTQGHLSDLDLNHTDQLSDDRSCTNLPKP